MGLKKEILFELSDNNTMNPWTVLEETANDMNYCEGS